MAGSVFIFDDDQDVLLMCGIVLQKQGYEVNTCHVTDDIVSRVADARPDLVIMDNKIPPYGGISATQILKKDPATRDIPVLFFSANLQVEQLSQEAGADAFIQKPFNLSDFENTVYELVHRKAE
jgi:CheY-like chemotaxis protein